VGPSGLGTDAVGEVLAERDGGVLEPACSDARPSTVLAACFVTRPIAAVPGRGADLARTVRPDALGRPELARLLGAPAFDGRAAPASAERETPCAPSRRGWADVGSLMQSSLPVLPVGGPTRHGVDDPSQEKTSSSPLWLQVGGRHPAMHPARCPKPLATSGLGTASRWRLGKGGHRGPTDGPRRSGPRLKGRAGHSRTAGTPLVQRHRAPPVHEARDLAAPRAGRDQVLHQRSGGGPSVMGRRWRAAGRRGAAGRRSAPAMGTS